MNTRYIKLFFFLILILGLQLNAEIQDGKVVAGAIIIRNYSLRSVKINGYEVKGGNALYLEPQTKSAMILNLKLYKLITGDVNECSQITSSKDLDRLFTKDNRFILSVGKQKIVLDIPLVDPHKPSIKFGRKFNSPMYFGCDMRNEELEYDVTIIPKWLFGQDIYIGRTFKFAQINGQKNIAESSN